MSALITCQVEALMVLESSRMDELGHNTIKNIVSWKHFAIKSETRPSAWPNLDASW